MDSYTRSIFFRVVRIILLLSYTAYSLFLSSTEAGVSYLTFLLSAVYICAMSSKDLIPQKYKPLSPLTASVILIPLFILGGNAFVPLLFFSMLEILSSFDIDVRFYLTAAAVALIPCPSEVFVRVLLFAVTLFLYIQNKYIIEYYRRQMFEDTLKEQGLKRDIERKETESRLLAENRILEERAALSQTLHDKLGHNINGSIYQLEAANLLLEKDPEKSRSMIRAVTDQLRSGMDEIRAILRKERPEKKRLAMIQLYNLCNDCNGKGVEAELQTEGDISQISDSLWELILDNAFEAVSNSMKYSNCKHIDIRIIVMNKMLRCSISDDGVGCSSITDGMGIAGMRQRMRTAGGILDFETGVNAGFTVNMLIPMGG